MKIIITESQYTGLLNNLSPKNLINESIEGKRCWYYKKIADGSYNSDKRVPNPNNGAGDVQEFLIKVGYNITKDWDFGNNTAKALGTWAYGAKENIDSVNKLWAKMKKSGWDVGETSGYGPKMMKAVASMIIKICKSLSKTCKVDQQTLFDMEFGMLSKEELAERNTVKEELNKSFKYAIDYWRRYLNTPKVQEKIYNNMTTEDYFKNMFSWDSIIEKYLDALNKVDKTGWKDYTKHAKEINATMYVHGSCPEYAICVNVDTYLEFLKEGVEILREKSKNTFVHEIQHILWSKVQKLNSTATIQQAFPASYDYYGSEKKEITNLSTVQPIPVAAKNELTSNGINYKDLIKYYSDPYWKKGYNCDWNEKLSNLESYRSYLEQKGLVDMGEDIPLSIITKHIKSTINNSEYISSDFERMIGCWVMGNFEPKLSAFVKELNELAKDEISDKDYDNPKVIDKTPEA